MLDYLLKVFGWITLVGVILLFYIGGGALFYRSFINIKIKVFKKGHYLKCNECGNKVQHDARCCEWCGIRFKRTDPLSNSIFYCFIIGCMMITGGLGMTQEFYENIFFFLYD
ncbi:hypothetical protein [Paenibacillus xylanilyticus]|uniref:Uncharacterized protein n=1 Tax=Paenibacillus xylanilyticus TaxID=248903 RepID=A0A7Y6C4N7_9BACL|nr:hypothetical protein [Paenibacillus xylanilyticus]NUU80146.1 hypothetical protein [Paenibacillus xylanilyticus]